MTQPKIWLAGSPLKGLPESLPDVPERSVPNRRSAMPAPSRRAIFRPSRQGWHWRRPVVPFAARSAAGSPAARRHSGQWRKRPPRSGPRRRPPVSSPDRETALAPPAAPSQGDLKRAATPPSAAVSRWPPRRRPAPTAGRPTPRICQTASQPFGRVGNDKEGPPLGPALRTPPPLFHRRLLFHRRDDELRTVLDTARPARGDRLGFRIEAN